MASGYVSLLPQSHILLLLMAYKVKGPSPCLLEPSLQDSVFMIPNTPGIFVSQCICTNCSPFWLHLTQFTILRKSSLICSFPYCVRLKRREEIAFFLGTQTQGLDTCSRLPVRSNFRLSPSPTPANSSILRERSKALTGCKSALYFRSGRVISGLSLADSSHSGPCGFTHLFTPRVIMVLGRLEE